MSYDLAVWEGDIPANDVDAAATHERLYGEYLDGDEVAAPFDSIVKFVAALTSRWPDRNTDDDTPWASEPLISGASGPYIYLNLSWSKAEVTSAYVAETASEFGLTCFDPQIRSIRVR